MKSYSLSHLADQTLLRDLAGLDGQHRTTLAALLAHLAEFDARRLYLPAAFPSTFAFCVHELHWCEQAALKRIRAARTARRFPAIFPALASGRLHLSAVVMLTPHMTPESGNDLLEAAAYKTKSEIEQLLAERFPSSEVLALVQALSPPASPTAQLSPGTVAQLVTDRIGVPPVQVTPRPAKSSAPGRRETQELPSKLTPIASQRFALQLTIGQSTHDKLRYAQELLSHQVRQGDVAQVLDRALDALIPRLEKRKFAATENSRRPRRSTSGGRHIPAHVKRAVWERDGGRCTFVSESGCRCPARTLLEFDHIDEVARGGQATIERMRLRCRAHNQYAAERTFGVEFMRHKRDEARRAATTARAAREKADEVIPWLRALGFRAHEARRAAERCETDAPLEQRVRIALTHLAPRASSLGRVAPGGHREPACAQLGV